MFESGAILKKKKELLKFADTVLTLTLLDDESVKEMKDALVKILREEYEKSKK
jgi:hypothetical protein